MRFESVRAGGYAGGIVVNVFAENTDRFIRQATIGEEAGLSGYLPEPANESNDGTLIFSFVVRVWVDDNGSGNHALPWRGHIMPVPDGELQHFKDFSEIPILIEAYLAKHR